MREYLGVTAVILIYRGIAENLWIRLDDIECLESEPDYIIVCAKLTKVNCEDAYLSWAIPGNAHVWLCPHNMADVLEASAS